MRAYAVDRRHVYITLTRHAGLAEVEVSKAFGAQASWMVRWYILLPLPLPGAHTSRYIGGLTVDDDFFAARYLHVDGVWELRWSVLGPTLI